MKHARGFTIVEVVITLGLLGLVMASAGRLILTQKRLYRELGQRADLSDNLRAGAQILGSELWGLDAADGDILAIGPDSIRFRAERAFGVVCGASGGGMLLRRSLRFGIRDFAAGDSVVVWTGADSGWRTGVVTSGPGAALCPDSTPAEKIGGSVIGSLVRAYEVVTYRSYRASDGAYYLGLRDAGGLQPVVGPLAASGGLKLWFLDSLGAATANPRDVAVIRIRLHALSAEPVTRRGVTALLDDSVVACVTLRNNLHS